MIDAFSDLFLSSPSHQAKGLELDVLFGNMEQVIGVAESFLNDLQTTSEKPVEDQLVGEQE